MAHTNTTVRNNILIRAKSSAKTYQRVGKSTNEHVAKNLEALDTSISNRDKDSPMRSQPRQQVDVDEQFHLRAEFSPVD